MLHFALKSWKCQPKPICVKTIGKCSIVIWIILFKWCDAHAKPASNSNDLYHNCIKICGFICDCYSVYAMIDLNYAGIWWGNGKYAWIQQITDKCFCYLNIKLWWLIILLKTVNWFTWHKLNMLKRVPCFISCKWRFKKKMNKFWQQLNSPLCMANVRPKHHKVCGSQSDRFNWQRSVEHIKCAKRSENCRKEEICHVCRLYDTFFFFHSNNFQ